MQRKILRMPGRGAIALEREETSFFHILPLPASQDELKRPGGIVPSGGGLVKVSWTGFMDRFPGLFKSSPFNTLCFPCHPVATPMGFGAAPRRHNVALPLCEGWRWPKAGGGGSAKLLDWPNQ